MKRSTRLALHVLCMLTTTGMFVTGLAFQSTARAQNRDGPYSSETRQARGEVQIEELNDHLRASDIRIQSEAAKIEDLQKDVNIWKGAVLGFGSIVTILELLQVVGISAKSPITRSRERITRQQDS